jgi:putative two-component system response regulator
MATIPLEAARVAMMPPRRAVPEQDPEQSREQSRKRVLIVDDDPDFVALVRRSLAPLDAITVEARDGFEAVLYAKQYPPSLVLLDLRMPRLDGWAVLHVLQDFPATRQVPVMLLTGHPALDEQTARDAGAVALVRKPVSPRALRSQVAQLLDP